MAEKIVEFEMYCKSCKHEKKSEEEFPCFECLGISVNEDSRRPVYWEEKK